MNVAHKSFEKIVLEISWYVEEIQEKVGSQVSIFATSGLHEVNESLEMKMKSYAKVINSAHISLCPKQEIEKTYQFACRKNLRIFYLPKSEK